MKPILIIAPHNKIAQTAKEAAGSCDDVEVRLGLLNQAIAIADQAATRGVEVLISRGGTAELLEESLPSLPVVECAVSPYDLVNTVHRARSFGRHITVIGFKRVIEGVEQLAPILDVDIVVKRIRNQEEAETYLQQRLMSGGPLDVLMGGAVAEALALQYGIPTVFLETGEAAIKASIKEARRLVDVQRKERQKTEQFKAILHYINQGVVAIDADGRITTFNPAASKMTGIDPAHAIGKQVRDLMANDKLINVMRENRTQLGQLQKIGESLTLTNRVPIVVSGRTAGAVATFEDVTKIQEYERKIRSSLREKGHLARYTLGDILGDSRALVHTKRLARKYADVDSTVLIAGESGTGKEMFAQGIHTTSRRKKGPFVAVNCAAIPDTLLESELFGYEEGAFTGARKKGRLGLFTVAHGGTIFLDEIAEITAKLQTRLLRVIQEHEVSPLGSDKVIPVDVRVIAATNRNLPREVERGTFRSDLYYRLCILHLKVPPLRARNGDIRKLSRHFVELYAARLKKRLALTESAISVLERYEWPGNIRELENISERLCVVSDREITAADVLGVLEDADLVPTPPVHSIKALQHQHVLKTLEACGGNRTAAAAKLGISRTSLWRILKIAGAPPRRLVRAGKTGK